MNFDIANETGQPIKVALLGCGVVGSQVARIITTKSDVLRKRIGRSIELVGVAVRDAKQPREGVASSLLTEDAMGLVSRGDVDIVVELMGGIEPAKSLVLKAIENGADIITANKALLAEYGDEIFPLADKAGVDLYYEASVAGAIPTVRPLRESLIGDEILAVKGIVNGTTNYILDQMHTNSLDFEVALKQAQDLGFAEADPTADVEGHDAAAKCALLASLAFHTRVNVKDVYCEGISSITKQDIDSANALDAVIKLLAVTRCNSDGEIEVRVHPVMVPLSHPLATVKGANNAIFIEAREAGELMFMGPGAGGAPTASAVMGDLVTVARNRVRKALAFGELDYQHSPIAPMSKVTSRYYVRMEIEDRYGILEQVAAIFAKHKISILTVQQLAGDKTTGRAPLVITTHMACEADMQKCVADLEKCPVVENQVRLLRLEGE